MSKGRPLKSHSSGSHGRGAGRDEKLEIIVVKSKHVGTSTRGGGAGTEEYVFK